MELFDPSNPAYNAIIIYIIIIVLLVLVKPDVIYDHKLNKYKEFGFEDNKTVLSLYVISIILALIIFALFAYIEQLAN